MDTIGPITPSTRYIADSLGDEDFRLVDIGCAYGLAESWRAFGEHLAAIGFDGDAAEIARLTAEERNPKVRYVEGLVGLPPGDFGEAQLQARAFWDRNASDSLSWARTQANTEQREYSGLTFAGSDIPWVKPDTSSISQNESGIDLATFLPQNGFSDIDFLKIDVDGPDFLILQSLQELLHRPETLGVGVEVNFFGSDSPSANTFHNMDRLLRSCGFEMFNVSVRRYASAALPWPYAEQSPSLSIMGRPYQGDAVYLKDVASPVRQQELNLLTPVKLVKAAALMALHGLYDQAAQIALARRADISSILEVDHLLELLTMEIQGPGRPYASYADYMSGFDRQDPYFFGQGGYQYVWKPFGGQR